jgi:hypothetical protein
MKPIKYHQIAFAQIIAFLPVFFYFLFNNLTVTLLSPQYAQYDKSQQIVLLLFIVPFVWFILQYIIIYNLQEKVTNSLPIFIGFLHVVSSLLAFILGEIYVGSTTFSLINLMFHASLSEQFIFAVVQESTAFFTVFFALGQLIFFVNIIILYFKKTKSTEDLPLDMF